MEVWECWATDLRSAANFRIALHDLNAIPASNFLDSDFGTASKVKSSFSLPILGLPYRPGSPYVC